MCDQQSLRSACAYAQSDQSLCLSLEYSMTIKLLTEHHLEFLSLKGGCTGPSESTLVKMPHCWKSHVAAHISLLRTDTVVILAYCEEINFGLQFHRKVIINLFFFMLNTTDKPKALKRDSIYNIDMLF